MNVLAIDPGNEQSAFVLVNQYCTPLDFAKLDNEQLLALLPWPGPDVNVVIEMIGHYGTGMPAGKTVFDTCIWIGRYIQAVAPAPVTLVLRPTVKAHLCGTAKANDANITAALVDRFAPHVRNHGKGTRNDPGFFYRFSADIWQAFAVAVQYCDTHRISSAQSSDSDKVAYVNTKGF